MKFYKLFITTICFVFLFNISILANDINEWSWEYGDYQYYLVKQEAYEEWNTTNVSIQHSQNMGYIIFSSGTIEGELAEFDVSIYDLDYYEQYYRYSSNSGLSHSMSFGEFNSIELAPGTYRLSIVAKGYEDQSLDDYILTVTYNDPNNNGEEIVTKDNNNDEVVTDKNNNGEVVTNENNNSTTNKTDTNNSPTDKTSTTSKDNTTTIAKVTPPKKVIIKSAKRLKNKKKVKISWKKLKGNNIRYEIKCSTSKKFTKKTTKTYTTKKYNFTISNISKNKKYYIKLRAYITIDKKKKYGSYSRIATIKKVN